MEETFGPYGFCTVTGKIAKTSSEALVANQAATGAVTLYNATIAGVLLAQNGAASVADATTPKAVWLDLMPIISCGSRERRVVLSAQIDHASGGSTKTMVEDIYAIIGVSNGAKLMQKIGTLTWTGGTEAVPSAMSGNTTRTFASAVAFSTTGFLPARLNGADVKVATPGGSGLAEACIPDSPGIEGYIRIMYRGSSGATGVPTAQFWC